MKQFEAAVIATIMADNSKWHDIIHLLKPDYFHHYTDEAHAVWLEMENKGRVNPISVKIPIEYVDFPNFIDNAETVRDGHIQIVEQNLKSESYKSLVNNIPYKDVLAEEERKRSEAYQEVSRETREDVLDETYNRIIRARESAGLTGITTGFKDMDESGGWQRGDLNYIAARPGMGKTALMVTHILAAVEGGHPALVNSLELAPSEMWMRFFAAKSGVSVSKMRQAKSLTEDELKRVKDAKEYVKSLPLFVETSSYTLQEVKALGRKYRSKFDVDIFAIDYVQLMKGSGQNRHTQVEGIVTELKALAKELYIPFLVMSQISRAVENRGGTKRPMLSDMKESGSLEESADEVLFIHRPEYYGMKEDPEGNSLKGVAEIYYGKRRNGDPGEEYKRMFKYPFATFTEIASEKFIEDEDILPVSIEEDDLPF